MAFSFSQSLVLLVLSLAFLSGCFADLIADVCSRANDPSLCSEVLRAPRQREPDLFSLGQIAFSQAQDNNFKLQSFIRSLIGAVTDPELKQRYTLCLQAVNLAVAKLYDSNYSFHAKSYPKMLLEVNAAMSLEASCSNYFRTPPPEPVLLKQGTDRVIAHTSIFAAVAKALNS